MKKRRALSMMLVGVMAFVGTVIAATPALAEQALQILEVRHAPGSEALPAGADYSFTATIVSLCTLTCGGIPVKVSYKHISGETRFIERTLPAAASQDATFTIPGADIYWWNSASRTPYVFGYWIEASQVQGMQLASARSPVGAGTMHERNVQTQVKIRFTKPDGTAAANVPLLWSLQADGALYQASTDDAGIAKLVVPDTDTRIAARQASHGYTQVWTWAFDQLPETVATVQELSGLGSYVVTDINLGNPSLPPIDRKQGSTYKLRDERIVAYPKDSPEWEASKPTCNPNNASVCGDRVDPDMVNWIPVFGYTEWQCCADGRKFLAPRYVIGGGRDEKTRGTYEYSGFTKTSHFVNNGFAWWTSEGETNAVEETSGKFCVPTCDTWNTTSNGGADIKWVHARYRTGMCQPTAGGCYKITKLIPWNWTGGARDQINQRSYHDTFDLETDTITPITNDYEVTTSNAQGADMEVAVDIDAEITKLLTFILEFGTKTKTSDQTVQKATIRWQAKTTDGTMCHYLFIRNGQNLVIPVPFTDPGRAWTHSISNPSPGLPCADMIQP